MEKISVIHWSITSRCNMQCGFCFRFLGKDLQTSDCYRILDKISGLGIKKLVITGGEPLLRKDIFKIVEYAKDKGFVIRLDTNGLLLSNCLEQIKMLDSVGISLDGSNPMMDQKMRNNLSHFKAVIKSLKFLKNKSVKIVIHTLVTKINYDDILAMASLLQKYPIYKWCIFEFCPYAKGYENKNNFQLKKGEFEKLKKKIKYRGKVDFCGIKDRIKAYFFITSDGSIYTQPKEFSQKYPVWGNIFKDNPEKFLKSINIANNIKRSKVF